MGTADWGGKLSETIAAALIAVETQEKAFAAVATVVVPAVIGEVASALGRIANRSTQALLAAEWMERQTKWAIETGHVLKVTLPELEARVSNLEAQLRGRALDPEFRRLLFNFGIEAAREAIEERFRMLVHATAGAFNVTSLTIAQTARAERTIRELDPEDITALRHVGPTGQAPPKGMSIDAILAAGCVRDLWGAGGIASYTLTGTGSLVLAMLRSYTPPSEKKTAEP
jgi:hypothetical protein